MHVYIDIETIPGQHPGLRQEIAAQLPAVAPYQEPTCPRNIKRPETQRDWQENTLPGLREAAIQKYQDDLAKHEAAIETAWRKTALQGEHGEIICIAWAIKDNPITVVSRSLQESEADLLRRFFQTLHPQLEKRSPTWIGHHVTFDLRFLFQRAVIHGVYPIINLPIDAGHWDDRLRDTMTMWAGSRERISLNRLCRALGIPTKGQELADEDIDGSKVWDFVLRGEIDKVATYCKADVARCREVYRRLTFADVLNNSVATRVG